jgi:pimeloyl-ACP methyl ester carboxylesterase
MRRYLVLVIGAAILLAACSAGPAANPTAAPPTPAATASLANGITVDIGGRKLFIYCVGTGSPTVILEAGMTGDHRTWENVVPDVSAKARVCAYDRANIEPSDPAPKPRDAKMAVADLHALLAAAHIDGPYVLVGFSLGGIISQLYASTYPTDVKGLVLVASNHPDENDVFDAHLTATQIAADKADGLNNPEGFDPFASLAEAQAARNAGPLPSVPFVVISGGKSDPDVWPEGWDPAVFNKLADDLQKDLVTFIPGGRQVIATKSGHDIPRDQPELIVQAILSVLGGS